MPDTKFAKVNREETFTEQVTFEAPIVCDVVALNSICINEGTGISSISVNTSATLHFIPVTNDYGDVVGYVRVHPPT